MIDIRVIHLKQALQGFSKVISRRSSLPVLGHIRMAQTATEVLISATNLDEYVVYRIPNVPVNGGVGDAMLIPFDRLNRIIRDSSFKDSIKFVLKDDCITLEYLLGGNVAELNLSTLPSDTFPSEPQIDTPAITLDDKFKAALKVALDCSSEDSTRPILAGACMDVSNSRAHYVVGTDGRHLFSANSFCFDIPHSVTIPNSKFINWIGFMEDGEWKMNTMNAMSLKQEQDKEDITNAGWIKIQSDHWTFITKQIEGKYPNWQQVIPSMKTLRTFVTFNDEGVKMMLEVLPRLPGNDSKDAPVSFSVVEKRFIVMSHSDGNANVTKITVPGATVKGPPISITVNRNFALKALKSGLTEMAMEGPKAAMMFVSEGRKMVVMPISQQASPETKSIPAAASTSSQAAPNGSDTLTKQENPAPVQSTKIATTTETTEPSEQEESQTHQPQPQQLQQQQPQQQIQERNRIPMNEQRSMSEQRTTTAGLEVPAINRLNCLESNSGNSERSRMSINPEADKVNNLKESTDMPCTIKSAMQQIEQVRITLRDALADLNDTLKTLAQVQREQRNSEKEVEAIRDSLRSLQKVRI